MLSELENFKSKKQIGLKLMDAFSEMVKLAIVTSTVPGSFPIFSSDSNSDIDLVENKYNKDSSEAAEVQRNTDEILKISVKTLSGVNYSS